MMKKTLLSCLLGIAAFSAAAVETTVTYTYAGDEYRTWGRLKSELYDVAIHIVDPSMVGKKITSIRAVLNAYEGIEATSIWLSKELTLEKIDGVKVMVPDTYSASVPVEKTYIPGKEGTFGELSSTLDTPYEITSKGIYVGYSLTVPDVPEGEALSYEQKQPVLLTQCFSSESFYARASKDIMAWKSLNPDLQAAVAIYVTVEGEFKEYCVGMQSILKTYKAVNEDFAVQATISNTGANPVSKIGYTYTIGGKDFENTIDLDTPIETNFEQTAEVSLPIAGIAEPGDYTLGIKITDINGEKNVSNRPSASTRVSIVPYAPLHRPMLEEQTGTWCGWCTRGLYSFERLNELYGDNVVLAAYHIGDPMAKPTPIPSSSAPVATLNRNGMEDPFYGNDRDKSSDLFGMKYEVLECMNTVPAAAIEVQALWANEEKTVISAKAAARFLADEAEAGYKFGYLLIANGLTGKGADWIQSNTYGSPAYIGGPLWGAAEWPSKIVGMEFNDVVIDVTGMKGVDNSLPSEILFNTPYENEFSFDIADNELVQNKDNLYVAAFILKPDGSIANADKVKVSDLNSVKPFESALTEVSVEYFNLNGIKVAQPGKGIFVKVSKMSDGSTRTSKIILP